MLQPTRAPGTRPPLRDLPKETAKRPVRRLERRLALNVWRDDGLHDAAAHTGDQALHVRLTPC